ncbi:ecdysone-induced protein [Apis cerana cerana]|uniref:Ecdysone-induced protein n=1 Tax=Apis cerana cerana TaxID=94128 RepID=A0A2A3EFB3_APICC|nr:ecdysone-induced protein [Apis cerana cerana]
MTVQEFKPRGSSAEEQQPSGDILSPSSEPLDNDKEQSAQVCYRGAPQDSENLLGRVLAGFVKEVVLGVEMFGKFVEYREVRCLQGYEKLSLRKRSFEDSRYCGEVCGVSGVLVFGVV